MKLRKKAVLQHKECVACGSCVKACKVRAIFIRYGIHARVDQEKCVGCARCEASCPAGIISMRSEGIA